MMLIVVTIRATLSVIFTTTLCLLRKIIEAKQGLVQMTFLSILSSMSKELAIQQELRLFGKKSCDYVQLAEQSELIELPHHRYRDFNLNWIHKSHKNDCPKRHQ